MAKFNTFYWKLGINDEISTDYPQIQEAAKWIKQNETVAFPTETVYGLGANALSDNAVGKIFEAKGRPSDNPLIIHIGNMEQLDRLVSEIPKTARKLMNAFWPGPLTIIFKKKQGVPSKVTGGLDTVAIRMPDHPVALALINSAQLPIAAPSANRSGKPSPTTAAHVLDDLDGRITGVLDGGATGVGLESTVIDCTSLVPIILRPGGITKKQLEHVVGAVNNDVSITDKSSAPKSPGMKYTHYAPKAPLIVVANNAVMQREIKKARSEGKRVGVLTTEESKQSYDADIVIACGTMTKLETVATNLYGTLRQFDQHPIDIIFSEAFPNEGVGEAIMNRLIKASGGKVIHEEV